jgi:dTDP-4-dehydrorhamnose 3,5-epimerase
MKIRELDLRGIKEITLAPAYDSRGYFMRTYDSEIFTAYGIDCVWVQENHSFSERKNTVRGLHMQLNQFSEAKLVRCIRGSIFDVAVDLRRESEDFGKWIGMELSEHNMKALFIPRGFAHGYCTLTEVTEVLYKVDNFYNPSMEYGIIWNDNDLNINWPLTGDPIVSDKDSKNNSFKMFLKI